MLLQKKERISWEGLTHCEKLNEYMKELGSSIRRMYKYYPLYVKNSTPVIKEGNVFKLVIPYTPINGGINKNEGVNGNGEIRNKY